MNMQNVHIKTMTHPDQLLLEFSKALTQTARAYVNAANKVANSFGLSHATAWPVLLISRYGDGQRPGMIAEALGLDPASLVRSIDQLVTSGLVLRHDDPNDRRAKLLSLTDAGKTCAAALEEALRPFRQELLGDIDTEAIDTTLRTLQALKSRITQSTSAPAISAITPSQVPE